VIGINTRNVASRAATRPPGWVSHLCTTGVYLVRLGFRNKAGFHECPQCKSRSVWKADPYGTLEETLHRFLRLSPYRCARCDRRFMDSKIPASDAPPHLVRRWLSRASRLLHRTPLDEALKRYSIFEQPVPERAGRSTSQQRTDRSPSRSRSAGMEASGLGEKSGLRV
jgi:hypothetical protein